MIKLGIDVRFLSIDKRGMGRYLNNILKRFKDKNFSISLIIDPSFNKKNLCKQKFPNNRVVLIQDVLNNNIKFDIVWHPFNRVDFEAIGAKNVVTIHDVVPFVFKYKNVLRFFDNIIDQNRFKYASQTSDLILTVSNFSKSEIVKYLKVKEEKIKVVYPGVSEDFKGEYIKERLYDFNYFLYVGNTEERKNLKNLLLAYDLIANDIDLKLVIVGVDKIKNKLHLLPSTLDKIIFHKCVNDDILINLYKFADFFIFPSLYEGFGLPILEAFMAQTPVVASNQASIPEVGGDAIYYFNPYEVNDIKESILKLYRDNELKEKLIKKGIERVKNFKWSNTVNRIKEIFSNL